MRKIAILLLIMLCIPGFAMAGVFQLKPDLKLILPEVSPPWVVTTEPGKALVEHMAEHVREEAAAKGQDLTDDQARQIALKHARENQLFVNNQETGAHILISVSPLEQGEKAPSDRAVALSAEYAGQSVGDEGWTDVTVEQQATQIKGAQSAQLLTIGYTDGAERGQFVGIVGFAHPYWFWFYGSDHLKDPADGPYLKKILLGIEIRAGAEK